MGRFSRVSLLVGLLLFPALVFAQFNNNTTSPYSRFGLGDLHASTFGRTAAMGGAAIASRNSAQINLANPAAYNSVDSLSFLFEFGISGKFTDYKNDITSMKTNDVNFRYMAMNFRITNWMATSLGLAPYSDVGYNVKVNEPINNTGDVYSNYFGEGSLSRAYFGAAIQPFKNFSIGANLNYLFGALNHNSEVYFLGSSDFYNIQKYQTIRISDFGLNFGVQATIPMKNKQHVVLGAILENKPEYKAFISDITQKNLTSGTTIDQDTLNFQDEEKGTIQFPLSYGFGISYVKENKMELNFDYLHQAWSKAKFFGSTNPDLTDLDKFAIGTEWIPDKYSIRSYFNRVAYRAGLKYEKSYLWINNQQINDIGISFGVGIPIYRSNSTINVSAEFGRRGTQHNNLVLEKYTKLNLSVNLYDLWFIKRRFD